MKEYVRCKACGFIMEAGKTPGICPACGVPKTAFESYKMTVSEKRKKLLDLHIHPVILHFPQAFAVFGLVLMIVLPFVEDPLKGMLTATSRVIITLLPFAVAAGFLSGLYDGKLRFKKVTTPILKRKIFCGAVFLLSAVLSAILIQSGEISNTTLVLLIVFSVLNSACATILGLMGGSLLESKLPG